MGGAVPPKESNRIEHRLPSTVVLLAAMDEARQVGALHQDMAVRQDHWTRMERDGNRILRLRSGSLVPLVRQDGDNAALRIAVEWRDEKPRGSCKEILNH